MNSEHSLEYNDMMNNLYDKYFDKLLVWKTSPMGYTETINFYLSKLPTIYVGELETDDIEELSTILLRLIKLKKIERTYINENIKDTDLYESTFLDIKSSKNK